MQVPVVTVVAVDPDTVHTAGVLEVNNTVSPDDADAARVTDSFTAAGDGWAKAIVCDFFPAGFTLNECGTGRAGSQSASPSWEAVMVHLPAFTVVAVDPATVHMSGVLVAKETCSPELALAVSATRAWTGLSRGWSNVIVCPAGFTL